MQIENEVKPLAACTRHLVFEVAESDPDKFIDEKGEILTYKVLHYLGFDVAMNLYNKDIRYEEDMIVRCMKLPHMTYKTGVYKGRVRKEKVGYNGRKTIYKYHKLQDLYDQYGTLQPDDISRYVNESEMVNISEVGGFDG